MRPYLIAGAINVLVAGVLLGIPYTRGPRRAAAVPGRWAEFAACFYDSPIAPSPGLGLPPGERARYASLVVHGPSDWPARCEDALEAIPAEESMFLFPNIKNAEAQLRAAVALMNTEMTTLAERRAEGDLHVPDRPSRAMQRLRGALAELGLSSGVPGLDADRDAVILPDDEPPAPIASIVPLRVSEGRAWTITAEEGALLASTMDSRSVVHVRVDDDGVEQRVTRRPRLANAVLGGRRVPWILWSTSPATCAQAVDRCERRTTGLAALMQDRQTLEPMMWLGAHPLGSPARSVHVADGVAYVVTPHEDAARVLRFDLVEPTVRALGEEREAPRLSATRSWQLDARDESSVLWITGEPLRVAHAREGRAGLLTLAADATAGDATAGDRVEAELVVPAGRAPQLAYCDGWLVMASDRETTALRLETGTQHTLPRAIVPPEPAGLRVVCHGARLEVWTLNERDLSRTVCEPDACSEAQTVRDDVARFDVVAHGSSALASAESVTVLASTDDAEDGVVRVTRFTGERQRTFVPSPCWSDPSDGLCGEPRLATDGSLLVLVTRQEEDLRVVTSLDGLEFGHFAGLAQR